MRALQITATGSGGCAGGGQIGGYRAGGPVLVVLKAESAWALAEDGSRTELHGPVVALFYETGDWVEYGYGPAASKLEFSAARESDVGFHPCGPLTLPQPLPRTPRPESDVPGGPPWGREGVTVPIDDADATVLISIVAMIEGLLLGAVCPDDLFRAIRRRMVGEYLVAHDADQVHLGYALEALIQRIRTARGDYDEEPA